MMPGGRTTLTSPPLSRHDFDRGALRINANVAAATHGETRFEILGSGGAAGAYPTFAAKQGPLTFVSAEVPGGVGPELIVRVNGIAWKEAPDLLGAGPSDRLYTLQLDETGKPRIDLATALPARCRPPGRTTSRSISAPGSGSAAGQGRAAQHPDVAPSVSTG